MVAPLQIHACTPAELPALVALLDQEFVYSKGRSISLAQRYPAALHAHNCANILVACRGGDIAAATAIKRFDWITPERVWRGAMMGLVYTRAEVRGQGLASRLLGAAQEKLHAAGTDFAVLFSSQPGFYTRLGWTAADCGVLGTFGSVGGKAAGCIPVDANTIDALRLGSRGATMPRDSASYHTLPLPAERLELRASPDGAAYAIYGVQAGRAYVYEIGGAPSGFAPLWQDICAAARTVYINERRGSAGQHWLSNIPGISWREQALAMWLPLAAPACARHFSDWYVPFLDRI